MKLIEKKPTKRTAGEMFSTDNVDVNNEIKKVKKEDISFDDLLGMYSTGYLTIALQQ